MPVTPAPASAEQNAAFASPAAVVPIDAAAIKAMALPGFTIADIWGGYSPPKYIVKRMLGPAQTSVLFGESGHFKSVIAIDLAMCVASGIDFHGIRTHKAGVVYIAGEGHGGLRKRVRAWLLHHGFDATSEQPAIYITEAGGDLIGNPMQLRATVEHAKRVLGVDIGLVVIDTLAANFGMGDENHAGDMQAAVNNAKAAAQGASVLLLHHTGHGKDAAARERGSYALRGAADFRLRAVYDEPSKVVELQVLRVKDDEEPKPLAFAWRRIDLGWEDEDGEELTSVVLEQTEAPVPSTATRGASGLGANQETVLKALRRIYANIRRNLDEQGRDPTEGKALVDGLRGTVLKERRMDPKRFSEALSGLEKRGLVRIESVHIFLIEEASG